MPSPLYCKLGKVVKPLQTTTQLKTKISKLIPTLHQKYNVASIEIFGSYAKGEQTQKSDLDLLVTFSKPYNLWELLDVKEYLTAELHLNVDLVPKDSIKPLLKEQILKEAIPIGGLNGFGILKDVGPFTAEDELKPQTEDPSPL
jgi:predicted nucleotidyltransferase